MPQAEWLHRKVIHAGSDLRLEYSGPERLSAAQRVVVAFAPYDYPFDPEAGWGARSLLKRGIAHVCVFHSAPIWHQTPEFFAAMRLCRDFLGPEVALTTYGFSMGGYGAILAADALDADRVVAVSPQFSIDPAIAPFERRFGEEWAAMGPWLHDMAEHRRDAHREVIVLYDPMHRIDRRHEAFFAQLPGHHRCLLHGAGHAGIQAMREMGIIETLFDLLRGGGSALEARNAYRQNRRKGFRYLRKVGSYLHERKHPLAPAFLEWAHQGRFGRLIKRWRPYYE